MTRIELPVEGMTCQHCVRSVTQALTAVPGVSSATVDLDAGKAVVEGAASRADLAAAVEKAGYRVPTTDGSVAPRVPMVTSIASSSPRTSASLPVVTAPRSSQHPTPHPAPVEKASESILLDVEGMTCASCVARVEGALGRVPGVSAARANLATNQASVEFQPSQANVADLISAVQHAGYSATAAHEDHHADHASYSERELAMWRRRLIVAALLLAPLVLLHFTGADFPGGMWVQFACATAMQFFVGWPFLIGALRRARYLSTNMDTLVAIGTLAAYGAGVYGLLTAHHAAEHPMHLMDAGIILTFITLGKYLEAQSKGRASAAIRKLLDLAPPTANVLRDGQVVSVAPADVAVGETIVVRPGEKVPLDAKIEQGSSALDESWLSGESLPREKAPGDEILAGTINGQGSLTSRVTRAAGGTALAQVVELVRKAQESKTEIQRLADRVVAWFVPVVLLVALVTLLVWGLMLGDWSQALSSTVAVLVVACPCALGLATPTAILVASGRGAELGILIKEAHALEIAGRVNTVVLDKTGTITLGKPKVTSVIPADGIGREQLLAAAAGVEQHSDHPLAAPIVAAALSDGVRPLEAGELSVVPGQGVRASSSRGELLVGNERLLESRSIALGDLNARIASLAEQGQLPLLVAEGGKLLGIVALADEVAPHSAEAVAALHQLGVQTLLLSGDRRAIANNVARLVGIRDVEAEVLPADKQNTIERLRKAGRVVAMIGDGINDAPALAAADLGVAIGSGSDIAVEAADIVIASNDLRGVPRSVQLARRTLATIKQNLGWAFVYNLVLIPIAAGVLVPLGIGSLPPWAAAAAMALSSVSVVSNSLLLRARKLDR